MLKYEDQPPHVRSAIDQANALIAKGVEIHFKFTCLCCGSRQTFEEPNVFYQEGECEECKHITDLRDPKAELNFLAFGQGDSAVELARSAGLLGEQEPPKES